MIIIYFINLFFLLLNYMGLFIIEVNNSSIVYSLNGFEWQIS